MSAYLGPSLFPHCTDMFRKYVCADNPQKEDFKVMLNSTPLSNS